MPGGKMLPEGSHCKLTTKESGVGFNFQTIAGSNYVLEIDVRSNCEMIWNIISLNGTQNEGKIYMYVIWEYKDKKRLKLGFTAQGAQSLFCLKWDTISLKMFLSHHGYKNTYDWMKSGVKFPKVESCLFYRAELTEVKNFQPGNYNGYEKF